MILAYIVIPGVVATTTAFAALLLGAGLPVVLGCYFVAGFGSSILCILLAGLQGYQEQSDQELQQQIDQELQALRDSIRQDQRLRAGSPDHLAPVLFRSLVRHESHIRRHQDSVQEHSDYVVQVAR